MPSTPGICTSEISSSKGQRRLQLFERLGSVVCRNYVMSVARQCSLHQVARCRIVVR
jgi:hypothetical protein